MNITSFNVTDVGYHYVGLRVLAAIPPTASRDEKISAVSRSVSKYVIDQALRFMLPPPRSNFEAVGEKVCRELVHLRLVETSSKSGYVLTPRGKNMLTLLNSGEYSELRRAMTKLHLETYDNLRDIVSVHLDSGPIFSPIVEAGRLQEPGYLTELLEPTFRAEADVEARNLPAAHFATSAKQAENHLRECIVKHLLPNTKVSVPIFRAICDRLVSLRLLNLRRSVVGSCEYSKSYSPCTREEPEDDWHRRLDVHLPSGEPYEIYLSDPPVENQRFLSLFLDSLDGALKSMTAQAGYYDLPELRDIVCERLMIPHASFDEAVNRLLDGHPSPLTVGLTYDRISAGRRPLIRRKESTQIFNLIRRS